MKLKNLTKIHTYIQTHTHTHVFYCFHNGKKLMQMFLLKEAQMSEHFTIVIPFLLQSKVYLYKRLLECESTKCLKSAFIHSDVVLKGGAHNVAQSSEWLYFNRSDWWTPENDTTRGSDLNGSWNYHSGTNKTAFSQTWSTANSQTMVRTAICRRCHGGHPDVLYLARFHLEIYYSCNKILSSLLPGTVLVSLQLLNFWGISETVMILVFHTFVPVVKWCSVVIQYMLHSSYRLSVSQSHTSQKVFSGTTN